jgi:cation diffusion facilitator family transporter
VEATRIKIGAALLSVVSNTVLVLLKFGVGIVSGSMAIVSEGIHSAVDLLASFIALFAVRAAARPADDDHPFGHGKAENLSGAAEAVLILLAAGWIIYEAIHKLLKPEPVEHLGWGVAVMAISALANLLISTHLFRVGKATDSMALQADAWHLRTDVYTSAGVMVGLLALLVGRAWFPGANLSWIDPVAAILVALLIFKAGWTLTREAIHQLMDTGLPSDEVAWIREYISRLRPTIRGFHHLRTRKAGSARFIEFHLIVEAEMSVEDSHRISEVMACDIEEKFPGAFVNIHVEPCNGVCKPTCLGGCLLDDDERAYLFSPR